MGSGSNLVIQQVGDVSRMQEAMQKSAELQQHTAAQEQLRQEQLQRSQILKSERSATNKKVEPDGKEEKPKQSQHHGKKGNPQDGDNAKSAPGGLLDIIV